MKTKPLIVTNNDKVRNRCPDQVECRFLDGGTYLEVLKAARDCIHQGCRLLNHPMAGSLKPNQTPFKTIVLDAQRSEGQDWLESVHLIENSIEGAEKFLSQKGLPPWPEHIREDFKTVDLSLVKRMLEGEPLRG
ncbi:MAG: GrdX family protein [Bacillota bacterium]|nr:GrdX family protein [Bacillota bacterium]